MNLRFYVYDTGRTGRACVGLDGGSGQRAAELKERSMPKGCGRRRSGVEDSMVHRFRIWLALMIVLVVWPAPAQSRLALGTIEAKPGQVASGGFRWQG